MNSKELNLILRAYTLLTDNFRYFPREEERKTAYQLRRDIEHYLNNKEDN